MTMKLKFDPVWRGLEPALQASLAMSAVVDALGSAPPNCEQLGCLDCDDPDCNHSCHTNHERFDLPEREYPSREDTGIKP